MGLPFSTFAWIAASSHPSLSLFLSSLQALFLFFKKKKEEKWGGGMCYVSIFRKSHEGEQLQSHNYAYAHSATLAKKKIDRNALQ